MKLTLFPNDDRIKKGEEIKNAVHEQAAEMAKRTAENNVHLPLLPGVLPIPGEQRFAFQQAYLQTMQKTLPGEIQSTYPPTDEEIYAEANRLWRTDFEPQIIVVAGKAVNQQQKVSDWQDACAKLPTQMHSIAPEVKGLS